MQILRFKTGKSNPTDIDIIEGVQRRDRKYEVIMYKILHAYFLANFNDLHKDPDMKEEVFQTAYIKLWTEIENKKIRVIDGRTARQQKTGEFKTMTASLTTFFLTYAINELRELRRNSKEDPYDESFEGLLADDTPMYLEESHDELKARVVDECIQSMSETCKEIITLFYYEMKSLDQIMELRGDKHSSKDGLKTSKSKCIVTLKGKIMLSFKKLNIAI